MSPHWKEKQHATFHAFVDTVYREKPVRLHLEIYEAVAMKARRDKRPVVIVFPYDWAPSWKPETLIPDHLWYGTWLRQAFRGIDSSYLFYKEKVNWVQNAGSDSIMLPGFVFYGQMLSYVIHILSIIENPTEPLESPNITNDDETELPEDI